MNKSQHIKMKSNSLIKRVATALIMVPIIVWLILDTSAYFFAVVSALFYLGAAWEWAALIGVKTKVNRFAYMMSMLAALPIVRFIPDNYVLWIGVIWWLWVIFILYHYVKTQNQQQMLFTNMMIGFLVILPCWVGLNSLRSGSHGAEFLLLFFFLLWSVDSGAYWFGTKFGKRKLASRLSPRKTIVGVVGGFLFMLVFLVLGIWILYIPRSRWLALLIIAVIMNIFSIIGDLFASMLKRKANVKDSGNIMPGHGGFLDRMDSALAAAPVFALALSLVNLQP